ncbi:citrate synthase [Actinoplanes utahensis]|uniref:citrate synthase (unknown stereospecificity) n=1 Tax=Actinoplanes utahensis TaxID=1869 RepID=A0A0A6URJ8_ACTUT|nr:citrate synthase [Actinoplanes utahensis]KHD78750.1 citrate synthase [Actinoplanes utahensis]GIF32112.1 citrate synthase [Actinoplanes utahensis]
MSPQALLTTEEVATLLGVKPATVYAYVSRGLLTSRRNADGKNSLFARADVDTFLAGRRRATTPGIQTGITLIRDGTLHYRGHDATALARDTPFEAVAGLLWTGALDDVPFPVGAEQQALARAVTDPLPPAARRTDRFRVAIAAMAAADPLRFDTTPAAVVTTGRQLIATMVHALPPLVPRPGPAPRLAALLWPRLTAAEPTDAALRLLNAALVLLADHDIAASTLAARVAASTRAHPYAVVSAGLAAFDGPLHGAASGLAYPLVEEAMNGPGPVATIAERLRSGTPVPGFGHPLYPAGDPRARALFDLLGDGPAKETALRLDDAMRTRSGTAANVDLALAALALHHRMPADAGEAIFAVARTAGWLAHALEEYADRPLRFRPSGTYAGNPPA